MNKVSQKLYIGTETGLLTYFVNELRIDPNSTPYSFVTAISPGRGDGIIPADFADDEIVINQWLAEDINANTDRQYQ